MSDPALIPEADNGAVLPEANVASRLMRGGAARAAAFVAGNGLAALTAAFLTDHLGVIGFGEYSAIIAMTAVALIIADSGTTNLAARELVLTGDRARVASIVGLRFALAGTMAALMTLTAVAAGWRGELVAATALAASGMIAGVALSSYMIPAYARLELGRVGVTEFLFTGGASALVLIAVLADASLPVILAAQLVIGAPLALFAFRLAKGAMPRLPNFHLGSIRKLVLEAASFAFAVSIATLLSNFAMLTVSAVSDEHTQGIAGLSWRVTIAAVAAAAVLVNGAIPAISAAATADRRLAPAVEKVIGLAGAAGALLGVGAFVAAPSIIGVLGHGDFDDAIGVLQLYAFVIPLSFVAAAGCIVLLSVGIHRRLAYLNGVALLVTVVTTAAAVRWTGAEGIAVGNAAGVVVLLAGQVLLWRGLGRSAHPRLAPVALGLAVGVVAAAIGALLPLPNLLQIAAALVAFAGGLLATGALPPEATARLQGLRRAAG